MVGDISKFESMASGALSEESRKGSAQIYAKIGGYFKSISQRFLVLPKLKRGLIKTVTVAILINSLTMFSTQAHAWTKETHKKFLGALDTSKSLKVLVDKTAVLKDSTAANQNLIQIDSLSSNLRVEISESIQSMHRDFDNLIKDDKADELRRDVESFKNFASMIGDSTLKKDASDLEKYMDNLIQKRILSEKIVKEANNNSYQGKFNKTEKQVKELLRMLDNYPHLTRYVYLKGVIPVLSDLKSHAKTFAFNGKLNEANKMIKLAEDIANHENIDYVKKLTFDEVIMPMREDVAYYTLKKAKTLAFNNKFDEAETKLKKVRNKYPEQESLLTDAEHYIVEERIKTIKNMIFNDNFNEAKGLFKETQKKYPNYSQEMGDVSYDFGTNLIERTRTLVRNKNYKEAHEFLNYWEKAHFNEKMKDLRKELARQIEIHARGASSTSDSQSKLNWAKKFRL